MGSGSKSIFTYIVYRLVLVVKWVGFQIKLDLWQK